MLQAPPGQVTGQVTGQVSNQVSNQVSGRGIRRHTVQTEFR
jgi:hypothetical protein